MATDKDLLVKWQELRALRRTVTEAIEPLRRDKTLGSSLEAEVVVPDLDAILGNYRHGDLLAEVFISGPVDIAQGAQGIGVTRTAHHKCGRCWRHLPEVSEDGALCSRCDHVVASMGAGA